MVCENSSLIGVVIIIESFMVLSVTFIMNGGGMSETSIENFVLIFLCVVVVESAIALVISLSLCKKTSRDFVDVLFFY